MHVWDSRKRKSYYTGLQTPFSDHHHGPHPPLSGFFEPLLSGSLSIIENQLTVDNRLHRSQHLGMAAGAGVCRTKSYLQFAQFPKRPSLDAGGGLVCSRQRFSSGRQHAFPICLWKYPGKGRRLRQTPGNFFHRRLSKFYHIPGLFAPGHRNAGGLGRNFRLGWERHAHKTAEILLALSRAAGTDRDYLLHLQRRPGLSKESDPRIRPASRLRRAHHRFHHRNPIWNRSEQSLETELPDHTAAVRILPNPCERRREIIVSLDRLGGAQTDRHKHRPSI